MKWLLVNPRPEEFSVLGKYEKVMVPFIPMGLAYLAASLEERGAEVGIYDGFASPGLSLVEKAALFQPQVVGISCLTPTADALKTMAPALRMAVPGVKIVLGNIHATLFARELMEQDLADYVIHGEGEKAIQALDDCLEGRIGPEDVPGLSYLNNGSVCTNPPGSPVQDLDALPLPAWHLFDLDRYQTPPLFAFKKRLLPILASRGCPFRCYFCAQNVMSPTLRKRNMVKVADEIETVHNKTGVDLFWFCDAIFPLTRQDAKIFCREMTSRGLHKKIQWITETRVDLVDRPLLRMLKQAGLSMVLFGLESGDQEVLARIKPGVDLDAGKQAVAAARAEGVTTLGLFMLGLPGETRQTMEKTIAFARGISLDFAKFNRAVPYPGSRFFDEIYRGRDMPPWELFSSNYEPRNGEGIVYTPRGVTDQELIRLHKRAFFRFYVRPGLIARHLAGGRISPWNMLRGGGVVVRSFFEENVQNLFKSPK
ncbi:MAG: cobalamin-dependent protein [Desulfatibacillum sp.]|nr:cobalamin-dependent protein [Desulfatibacillum sp.]